jgi:hypothetical protein
VKYSILSFSLKKLAIPEIEKNPKIHMESQETPSSRNNLGKEKGGSPILNSKFIENLQTPLPCLSGIKTDM